MHVTSRDGTRIMYHRSGDGPAVVLVHGGVQAAQNFGRLAALLAHRFTVFVPDRRGRGQSGPHGDLYCMARECEDLDALLTESKASSVFGLSSGALIVLAAARALPAIRRAALYEPPLQLEESIQEWVPRLDAELARDDVGAALVTIMKGTGDRGLLDLLPRFLLVPFFRLALAAQARQLRRQAQAQGQPSEELSIASLVRTMHYDAMLVRELAGQLESFGELSAEVLLLGGDRSRAYLTASLTALAKVLPQARRVEFTGVGHLAADNGGRPEVVARELEAFFGAG
jgi:pimeloyl-ACP methyl ester carboxylesterase